MTLVKNMFDSCCAFAYSVYSSQPQKDRKKQPLGWVLTAPFTQRLVERDECTKPVLATSVVFTNICLRNQKNKT